ncbi:MAG: glycosyltransferase family 4 protein [Goleter apudmare HA4340-LM2]|jgi:glycosyltransferase involved in cell wall biosynthesis|nr:glycosyltransferase family 4 protein [Goleter apudmare HA4340-LM2]
MKWVIAAPFVDVTNVGQANWLEPFVPGNRHQFYHVPRSQPLQKWHDRKSKITGVKDWMIYWEQAKHSLQQDADGLITVFPQLASAVGMQQILCLKQRKPIISWLFNVGTCSLGLRQRMAQLSLRHIDRFVVHTRRECEIYSHWLKLPIERFEFVPYQAPNIKIEYEENTDKPFVTSLGSAHRDFPNFFKAVEKLKLPTVLAAGPTALESIEVPPLVQTPFGISRQDCFRLAQQGRIVVVPLKPKDDITAAGQVTIVEAMRMGRPVIATRCNGAEDYIIHGETGLLVEPNSWKSMAEAIELLWYDDALRQRLGQAAKRYADENFSDEAAGANLGRILDHVADNVADRANLGRVFDNMAGLVSPP